MKTTSLLNTYCTIARPLYHTRPNDTLLHYPPAMYQPMQRTFVPYRGTGVLLFSSFGYYAVSGSLSYSKTKAERGLRKWNTQMGQDNHLGGCGGGKGQRNVPEYRTPQEL